MKYFTLSKKYDMIALVGKTEEIMESNGMKSSR